MVTDRPLPKSGVSHWLTPDLGSGKAMYFSVRLLSDKTNTFIILTNAINNTYTRKTRHGERLTRQYHLSKTFLHHLESI